jgi:zinc protease
MRLMMSLNLVQSTPNSQNIVREKLDNGLVVLVFQNPSVESVVISGSLSAGSMYENDRETGLASMTASALMRGTQNRSFEQIHSSLEDIGADLNLSAGPHKVGFNGKALAEDLPVLLDVLADVLRHPTFPAPQVERLRGETLTWLQYREFDTRARASRAFRQTLYPTTHPYHYSVRGTLQTIPLITVEAIQAYHKRSYSPRGMVLCIVGNVEPQTAIDAVRRYFADWDNDNALYAEEFPVLAPLEQVRRVDVPIKGKTQSDIVMGVVGPSRFAADYQAANMANSILGQFGMMGRIGDVVREKSGMAYYASSRMEGGLGPGAWSISAGVNPANIDRAIELSAQEIERLISELVDEEELADNQAYYTGRLPLQLESSEGIAGTILTMETYMLGLDYLLNYHDMIYGITREQIREAAQRYWNPKGFVVAVAGPEVK